MTNYEPLIQPMFNHIILKVGRRRWLHRPSDEVEKMLLCYLFEQWKYFIHSMKSVRLFCFFDVKAEQHLHGNCPAFMQNFIETDCFPCKQPQTFENSIKLSSYKQMKFLSFSWLSVICLCFFIHAPCHSKLWKITVILFQCNKKCALNYFYQFIVRI